MALSDKDLQYVQQVLESNAPETERQQARELIVKARESLHAQAGVRPVGVAGTMPGTTGFTMACFKAEDVPSGTALYAAPSADAAGVVFDESTLDAAITIVRQARDAIGAGAPSENAAYERQFVEPHLDGIEDALRGLYRTTTSTESSSAPPGFVLVPVAPTSQMRKAAVDAWLDCDSKLILNKAAAALKAGIAAAPKQGEAK